MKIYFLAPFFLLFSFTLSSQKDTLESQIQEEKRKYIEYGYGSEGGCVIPMSFNFISFKFIQTGSESSIDSTNYTVLVSQGNDYHYHSKNNWRYRKGYLDIRVKLFDGRYDIIETRSFRDENGILYLGLDNSLSEFYVDRYYEVPITDISLYEKPPYSCKDIKSIEIESSDTKWFQKVNFTCKENE